MIDPLPLSTGNDKGTYILKYHRFNLSRFHTSNYSKADNGKYKSKSSIESKLKIDKFHVLKTVFKINLSNEIYNRILK